MNLIIKYILQFLFVVFMQTFVFQKIYLTTYCVPFFYSIIILTLPVFTNRFFVLILSFFIGVFFDMFYHTGGMHAASLVFITYLRYYWLKIIEPSERYEENQIPVVSMSNREWFLKYITPLVFVHHLLLFILESFSLNYLFSILIRSILSSLMAILLIYVFHLIFFRPKQK